MAVTPQSCWAYWEELGNRRGPRSITTAPLIQEEPSEVFQAPHNYAPWLALSRAVSQHILHDGDPWADLGAAGKII